MKSALSSDRLFQRHAYEGGIFIKASELFRPETVFGELDFC
jgi:hypothetical protein